jgi:hypothetical protein
VDEREDGDTADPDLEFECDDNEVVVPFDGFDVDDAERFFVEFADVTRESDGMANTSGNETIDDQVEAIGDNTNGPDLIDAEREDEDEWTYTFDENVTNCDAGMFELSEEDGFTYYGDTGEGCDISGDEVTITFIDTGIEDSEDFELVEAGVEEGAVQSSDDNEDNTIGSAAVGTSAAAPGFTDGPDLESVELDETAEEATFAYDENIDEDSADETCHFLMDVDTDESEGDEIEDSTDNELVVAFDETAIEDAVGGHVDYNCGAVSDFLGNDAPSAAAGSGTSASPTTGTGGTTTTTTTTTSTTTTTTGTTNPPPAKQRTATATTIRYDDNANKFTGSVGSQRKRCQQGRRNTLKKHRPGKNATAGRDRSNRSGNWAIKKNVSKGRFYVVTAKKTFTNRRGTLIICRRDKSPTIKI